MLPLVDALLIERDSSVKLRWKAIGNSKSGMLVLLRQSKCMFRRIHSDFRLKLGSNVHDIGKLLSKKHILSLFPMLLLSKRLILHRRQLKPESG